MVMDTFDGGFDTEEKFDLTAYNTGGNFDASIFDKCDFFFTNAMVKVGVSFS